jgi:transcriptional regulator with XRE-family HTH domain
VKNKESIKLIGATIRDLRQCKNIKVDYIAKKLGYEHSVSYLKLERGEKGDIGITQLFIICEVLECSLFTLFILSGLKDEIFNKNITNWVEFYESLNKLPQERKRRIEDLLKETKLKP